MRDERSFLPPASDEPVPDPLITIYAVTYRRPQLLARALRSLVNQTCVDWTARVVNDDPNDNRVPELIKSLDDRRIQLYEPVAKRGAAANFNLAFSEKSTPFASILEDDNWWEPEFLNRGVSALEQNPQCEMACGNERVWREEPGDKWIDTAQTIWPVRQGNSEWTISFEAACGSAKLCNSSLLFRTKNAEQWKTPDDIPVDVTEHFRERCVSQPILLLHESLVNYAETLATNRSAGGSLWSCYQCLLIGSCFYSLNPGLRARFAKELWKRVGAKPSPRATALLFASRAIPEAESLWTFSSGLQRLRFFSTLFRRIRNFRDALGARQRLASHWDFLCSSRYNRFLSGMESTN